MFSVVVYSQHYHNTFIFVIQKQQLKNKYFQLITATNASKRFANAEAHLTEATLQRCS